MKRNVIIAFAAASLMLFSCGEDTNPAEMESMATEIEATYAEADSLQNEIEAIETETNELDALLEDL